MLNVLTRMENSGPAGAKVEAQAEEAPETEETPEVEESSEEEKAR